MSAVVADKPTVSLEALPLLGSGATADVRLAEIKGGKVALKVFKSKAECGFEPEVSYRYERGMLATAKKVPNVVQPKGCFTPASGLGYAIAFEYCPGLLAAEVIKERVDLDRFFTKDLPGLIKTLGQVHALGLIHRDIKPLNLLRRRDETLVVADWGFSTRLGKVVKAGALPYSPPESVSMETMMLRECESKPSLDIWALAVTLWYVVSKGNYPFSVEFIKSDEYHDGEKLVAHWNVEWDKVKTTLSEKYAAVCKNIFSGVFKLESKERFSLKDIQVFFPSGTS